MALRTAPQVTITITHRRQTGVWLDISLVRSFSFKLILYHYVSSSKTSLNIAVPTFVITHNIFVHTNWNRFICSACTYYRRICLHSSINIGDVRQNFIFDFYQLNRIAGNQSRRCRNSCNRMAVVKRLFTCHNVFQNVEVPTYQSLSKIRTGHNTLYPFQSLSSGRINFQNPRMGVGRANDSRVQHAGGHNISTKLCFTSDFVHAVRAFYPCPDNFEILNFYIIKSHIRKPF